VPLSYCEIAPLVRRHGAPMAIPQSPHGRIALPPSPPNCPPHCPIAPPALAASSSSGALPRRPKKQHRHDSKQFAALRGLSRLGSFRWSRPPQNLSRTSRLPGEKCQKSDSRDITQNNLIGRRCVSFCMLVIWGTLMNLAYILGLLAMIKCSICSYRRDSRYVLAWKI
jgi:hypothetical protein